jgi:hypothetical protein
MTSTSATATSYTLYRSTTSGGENYTSPLATGISATTLTYTDSSVSPNTTYYYVVRPVVGSTIQVPTATADAEIKIMVPPTNMSLVHRWIANWEMCSNLMGRTIDRANNYRCAYVGPGNDGSGHYDLGHNQFWDTYEVGCNYTPPNATSALSCGSSVNGCLGTSTPQGSITGGAGQVFYDRSSGTCYAWVNTTNWTAASAASAGQLSSMASNQPGLPPLVLIDQQPSQTACTQFTIPGIGTKRLPKHSEQIVAAAWSLSLTDGQITVLENGGNLPSTGVCNTNSGSGLTFEAATTPINLETLPYTLASGNNAVRTGSTSTQNCLSLHKIQDLVGNVWEWSSDQLGSCAGNNCTSTGPSSVHAANTDYWTASTPYPIHFNNTVGPGGTASMEWNYIVQSFSATNFLAPLGLPLVGSIAANYDSQVIGTGSGQFNPVHFHTNHFWLDPGNGNASRGARAGGDWADGSNAGRFALVLINLPTFTDVSVGFRCSSPSD